MNDATLALRPEDGRAVRVRLEHRPEQRVAEHVLRVVLGAADLLEHHLDLARDLAGSKSECCTASASTSRPSGSASEGSVA